MQVDVAVQAGVSRFDIATHTFSSENTPEK
jgi:hypothetical protein